MIKYVVAYKSKKDGKSRYKVGYKRREMIYTGLKLPNTVLVFMQTHNYRIVDHDIIFE